MSGVTDVPEKHGGESLHMMRASIAGECARGASVDRDVPIGREEQFGVNSGDTLIKLNESN